MTPAEQSIAVLVLLAVMALPRLARTGRALAVGPPLQARLPLPTVGPRWLSGSRPRWALSYDDLMASAEPMQPGNDGDLFDY